MKLELEDIEGNTYNETIPKYPSARIVNKCEATFNAYIKATGTQEEGSVDNAMQALSEQKDIVISWLNSKWFDNDIGPDKISPPSQDKILARYAEYIDGMAVEEKEGVEDQKKS